MKAHNLLDNDKNKPDTIEVCGSVERVIYHNDTNGYTILRLRIDGKGDPETVVGNMQTPQPGTLLRIEGRHVTHPKFGRQLQMVNYSEERPSSEEGIRLFLASGCIKGIGEKWAERIVAQFKTNTLRILDEDPEKLLEIPRFGQKRLDAVKLSWEAHQGIRALMIFLQSHGIGAALAFKIYKFYEKSALDIVQENPYRLAMDIYGIGFQTADSLAMRLGFDKNSSLRAEAGLLYMLMEITSEGHIYYPRDRLIKKTSELLDIDEDLVDNAIHILLRDERIVIEDFEDHEGIYLTKNHVYESKISFYLKRVLNSPRSVHFKDAKDIVEKTIEKIDIALAPEQREAVFMATRSKIMVLTGGPGTGKTTILNTIIKVFQETRAKILLAAPTGRAAKRISETSGCEAKTIHRLLEFSPKEEGFGRNENNPLACGLLIVDEASMMDTMLMFHLIKAVPIGSTIIFVGDINQLPSVGPGNVLRDMIASGAVPVVELIEVFRQAAESDIICNAHRINKGEMPSIYNKGKTDFYFFKQDDGEQTAELIVDLVKRRIPQKFGYKSDEIQVLCPMTKGSTGTINLNKELQLALNTNPLSITRGDRLFKLGDRVMQVKNNYDKDVFNGDIGHIIIMDTVEKELTIRFDERNVLYSFDGLDEIIPAYAITIHKSQGGEYPVVIIPMLTQHYVMLERNLIYTAVTRGKQLVVIVGQHKALQIGVTNNKIRRRYTWLARRLAKNDEDLRMDMLPFFTPQKTEEQPTFEDIPVSNYDGFMLDDMPYDDIPYDDTPHDDTPL